MTRTKWLIVVCAVVAGLLLSAPLIRNVFAFSGMVSSAIATTNAKIAANETTKRIMGPAGKLVCLAPNYTEGWLIVTFPAELSFFPDYQLISISEDVSISSFYSCDSMPVVCGVLATDGTALAEPYFLINLDGTDSLDPRKGYSTTFKTRDALAEAWLLATGTELPEEEPHDIER